MKNKHVSEATIKIRIPNSLADKWGFEDSSLKIFQGRKIKSSEYLRNAIQQEINKDLIQIQTNIFGHEEDTTTEKTIRVPQELKKQINNKCGNCAMNTFILILLDSYFSGNRELYGLKTRVMELEDRLKVLKEEIWFMSVQNQLNMKSGYDPQKFFD